MIPQQKIDLILEWADDNSDFDTTFVLNMQEWLEDHGELTSSQEEALDNIIEKWRI